MESLFSVIASVTTVTAFVSFVAIVAWAYSARRREAFAQAANAPFALPDESPAEHNDPRQS